MHPTMRRIPRPSRSIDQTISSSQLLRPRVSLSPCRTPLASYITLRATSASFSTTPSYSFLIGKEDKKKHQAFVRRWQKRMLGDAEPIGAHVDPYDGTSPVRIAPEETGEEVEVLEEARVDEEGNVIEYGYEGAESGEGLYWIGGKEWVAQRQEEELEERFAKLTGRGYTTPTGFGRRSLLTGATSLQQYFHQAVVEVYALKQAGLNMDLAAYPKRGEFHPPIEFAAVKLTMSPTDGPILDFPSPEAQTQLLEMIQETPAVFKNGEEEVLTEELEEPEVQLAEPVKAAEPAAIGKAGALMKQAEGKAFDFMSNRPVPRSKPTETVPAASEVVVEHSAPAEPSRHQKVESQAEASRKVVADLRQTILDTRAQSTGDAITSIRNELQNNVRLTGQNSIQGSLAETKYRHIPLFDPAIKFALAKRLTQLTGHRISDPALHTSHTLGDVLGHLVSTAEPKPQKLFDQIKLASQAKSKSELDASNSAAKGPSRAQKNQRPTTGELLRLPNVKMQGSKVGPWQKDQEVGRLKVIEYALMERGLPEIRRREKAVN